jgi:hypothetical protein
MRGSLDARLAGACLFVGLLVVSACGSSTSSSSAMKSSEPASSSTAPQGTAAHVVDIAARILAAGVGCTDAADDPAPHPEAKETASCTIGGDEVAITLFADHNTLIGNLPLLRQGECFVAKTKPDENLSYVQGPNWIVFPQVLADTNKVADATGGSVVKIACNT